MADSCKHKDFHSSVDIVRIEDIGRFQADIHIHCNDCGRPFQFLGLPLGLNLNGAAMSVDGLEARLSIAPMGDVPQPMDKHLVSGFRLRSPSDH